MAGLLAPMMRLQFCDANGNPYAGGTLSSFLAGTTTAALTYNDPDLAGGHSNGAVITLDAAGRPSVSGNEVGIYFSSANALKFVLKDSAGSTVWTADNVAVPAQSTVVIPSPSSPNQVIRTTDGTNWTASDSPTLAALTTVGAVVVGTTLGVTGAVTLTVPLGVASGGVGASLAATGGTNQVLKQSSSGAVVTVGTLASTNLSDVTTWTAYTTTWTGGAGLAIGNGTLAARYYKIGTRVDFLITLTGGNTTNYGDGTAWNFTLPFTAADSLGCYTVYANDFGTAFYSSVSINVSTTAIRILTGNGSSDSYSSTVPFTWTTSDNIQIFGTYKSAA